MSNSKMKVVLFWVDSEKVSTEEMEIVNCEDRYVGAPTTVTYGKESFRAIVRLISNNKDKLNEMEETVAKEIDDRKASKTKQDLDKKTRSLRQRKAPDAQTASTSALDAALGQKVRAPPAQSSKVTGLKKASRELNKAAEDARNDVDSAVERDVFGLNGNSSDDDDSMKMNVNEAAVLGEASDEHDEEGSDDDTGLDVETNNNNSCHKCAHLREAMRKPVPVFLMALENLFKSEDPEPDEKRYVPLLEIPSNVPKCEVSKGSGVYMSVQDKNAVKFDSNGNPSDLVRGCLVKLFGRDVLETSNLTAVGTKQGIRGIKKEVRDAIMAFANRNRGKQYKALNKTTLTRVINRKKSQVQRDSGGTNKSGNKSVNRKKTSPAPVKCAARNLFSLIEGRDGTSRQSGSRPFNNSSKTSGWKQLSPMKDGQPGGPEPSPSGFNLNKPRTPRKQGGPGPTGTTYFSSPGHHDVSMQPLNPMPSSSSSVRCSGGSPWKLSNLDNSDSLVSPSQGLQSSLRSDSIRSPIKSMQQSGSSTLAMNSFYPYQPDNGSSYYQGYFSSPPYVYHSPNSSSVLTNM